MAFVQKDFDPSIIHPYYFIRRSLLQKITKLSSHLTGKLMDFGCGSKPYKSLFKTTEYIGVDYENEGHSHENEQIDVFYDGNTLPFESEYFDSVLCSEVIEHVFELKGTLKEINRVMKPGAHILITCPFVWNEHEVPYDFARYTRFALEDILEKSGFKMIHFEKSGNFITTITQLKVLYYSNAFQKKWSAMFFTRWIYKFLFVLVPNVFGLLMEKIYPNDQSLYLNNVLVAKKISS